MNSSFGSVEYTHRLKFQQEDSSWATLNLAVEDHTINGLSLKNLLGAEGFEPTMPCHDAVFQQSETGFTFVNVTNESGRAIHMHFLQPIASTGHFNMALIEADGTLVQSRADVAYTLVEAGGAEGTGPEGTGPEGTVATDAEGDAEATEAFFYVGPWRITVHWSPSSHDLKSASIERAL
jgi:hypothetical protein